ncbi:MAG: lipopolysaccharide biosynthesis protein [Halolamina sp.]
MSSGPPADSAADEPTDGADSGVDGDDDPDVDSAHSARGRYADAAATTGAGAEAEADPVEARLDDALVRVAHGAAVSVPSILLQRGLTLAFTAALTNGFGAGAYGLFALARRLQRYLVRLAMGFRGGLSRYLPSAADDAERDAIVSFAAVLLLSVAAAFGIGLAVAAPTVAEMTEQPPRFAAFLRLFGLGLPVALSLFVVTGTLRGLEEVGPLNLALRVGFPAAQLVVGAVGVAVGSLRVVAIGVVAAMGVVGAVGAGWLVRRRGLGLRLRGEGVPALRRRYFRYTLPLFLGGFATTTQRLGFYPLIAVFLGGVAGGVFAVGVLVGVLVRLPLMGINQFIPPVAASLHDEAHREALARLYHVTSRLVLVGVLGAAVPVVVFRRAVMSLFGPTFVEYAPLLPGFVFAQVAACAAGSVGILLRMTDNQRALLVTNVAITAILAAVAVPLTATYGLAGLVGAYVLMFTLNNGVEVAVLYYLEGLQPFTRRHLRPVAAAVPSAVTALAARSLAGSTVGPVVGTVAGLIVYAVAVGRLGVTSVERRLVARLVERYRTALADSV